MRWQTVALLIALSLVNGCVPRRPVEPFLPPGWHWVAADPHVHDDGCEPADFALERLLPAVRGAHLQVASVLIWTGDLERRAHSFTGRDHPASTPDLILHEDVEVSGLPAAPTGHLMLLGLTPPLDPVLWHARSSVAIVERLRAQRPPLMIGMAHSGWPDPEGFKVPAIGGAPLELPVLAALGDLDFIAFELALPTQPEHLDWIQLSTWSRLQNAGFPLPLVAASDYPCGNKTPGNTRSYVLIEGAPSYAKYLDAIKRGRVSMAVYGDDRLDFRIGQARIGDQVRTLDASVTLTIESTLPQGGTIRIMANGRTAKSVRVGPGRQVSRATVKLDGSAWIYLRSARAMTNPISVVVDGAPIPRNADDICYFLDWIDRVSNDSSLDLGSDRAASVAAWEKARGVLTERLHATGVTDCTDTAYGKR